MDTSEIGRSLFAYVHIVHRRVKSKQPMHNGVSTVVFVSILAIIHTHMPK